MIPHPSRVSSPRLGGSQPHTCSPRPALAPPLLSDVPELLGAVACTLQSFPPGRLLSAETQPFSPAGPVAAEQGEGRYMDFFFKKEKKKSIQTQEMTHTRGDTHIQAMW